MYIYICIYTFIYISAVSGLPAHSTVKPSHACSPEVSPQVAARFWCTWLRVQGSGFRVQGLGFRV